MSLALVCDFLSRLVATRARKCATSRKACHLAVLHPLLHRPLLLHLDPYTSIISTALSRRGGVCPLPDSLTNSSILTRLFAPVTYPTRLYRLILCLFRHLTTAYCAGSSSVCATVRGRTLFATAAIIGQLLRLVRRLPILDDLSLAAFNSLFARLLTSRHVPFRSRPTRKLRIVNIVRANGLSFARLTVISIGRNFVPHNGDRISVLPCGLHGTFGVSAIRRGVSLCTCCFCHLFRHIRATALVCDAISTNLRGNRHDHFLARLLISAGRSVACRRVSDRRQPLALPLVVPHDTTVNSTL